MSIRLLCFIGLGLLTSANCCGQVNKYAGKYYVRLDGYRGRDVETYNLLPSGICEWSLFLGKDAANKTGTWTFEKGTIVIEGTPIPETFTWNGLRFTSNAGKGRYLVKYASFNKNTENLRLKTEVVNYQKYHSGEYWVIIDNYFGGDKEKLVLEPNGNCTWELTREGRVVSKSSGSWLGKEDRVSILLKNKVGRFPGTFVMKNGKFRSGDRCLKRYRVLN